MCTHSAQTNFQAAIGRYTRYSHYKASWPCHTMHQQFCHCQHNKFGKSQLHICLDPSNLNQSITRELSTIVLLITYFTSSHKQKRLLLFTSPMNIITWNLMLPVVIYIINGMITDYGAPLINSNRRPNSPSTSYFSYD